MTTREFLQGYVPTLAEFKAHIRMTGDDLDATLQSNLLAAITSVEHHIGRYVAASTITRTLPFSQAVKLKGPVNSVISVSVDGVALDPSQYSVLFDVLSISAQSGDVLTVVYGTGTALVPYDIRAAILLQATSLFNNPSDSVETLPKASRMLLRPYRTYGLNPDGE